MTTNTKHPCAICPALVRRGYLMCAPHWHLVPRQEKRALYRAYRRMVRARGADGLPSVKTYREARDAAIALAQAQLTTTP